jgi:hypothetical protein
MTQITSPDTIPFLACHSFSPELIDRVLRWADSVVDQTAPQEMLPSSAFLFQTGNRLSNALSSNLSTWEIVLQFDLPGMLDHRWRLFKRSEMWSWNCL